MTARNKCDDHPFWQVQAVFDPDGGGKDFAYTIGLHDRGNPELHLWARPCLGDDPGGDWSLSMSDRTIVLNELAHMLLDGRLRVGSEVERRFDDGQAVVRFRVDPPGDREFLEAFGIAHDAAVLPVRWSLTRPPEGMAEPLDQEAVDAACDEYAVLMSTLDPRARAPRGWQLPVTPSYAPDQRFGPRTPLILARAAQLWQADDATLCDLIYAALRADEVHSLTYSVSLSSALARPLGRRKAHEAAVNAATELVEWLTQRPAAQRRWRTVVQRFHPASLVGASGRERVAHERRVAGLLHAALTAVLTTEVVADRADARLLLAARGPWTCGLTELPSVPGEPWHASEMVVERVCDSSSDSTSQVSSGSRGCTPGPSRAASPGLRATSTWSSGCSDSPPWELPAARGSPDSRRCRRGDRGGVSPKRSPSRLFRSSMSWPRA